MLILRTRPASRRALARGIRIEDAEADAGQSAHSVLVRLVNRRHISSSHIWSFVAQMKSINVRRIAGGMSRHGSGCRCFLFVEFIMTLELSLVSVENYLE